MTHPVRPHRRAVLAAAAIAALPRAVAAFPDRPLRGLVGFPPGAIPDMLMRLYAPGMGERLGQPVVAENRPGVAGALAAEALVRAPADGHTVLMMPPNITVLPLARRNLPFDVADVLPIAGTATVPLVLVVPPSLGVRDLAGFLRLARERGDRLAYGHSGIIASPNLCMSLLMEATGITPTAVTYRGDPETITGLLSGAVQTGYVFLGGAVPHLREGRLVGLGITSEAREPGFPDLPTMAELGLPQVTFSGWWALAVARATPAEVRERLAAAVRETRRDETVRARLAAVGARPFDLDGDALLGFVARERERMTALYRRIGVQPE